MDDAGNHGAVAKGGVLRLREVGARQLVEDGGSGLVHHQGRREGAYGGLVDVRKLGARTGDVAGEIVTRDKNALEDGMRGINAGVNNRDNTRTGNVESGLRVWQTDNRTRWLGDVAVRDGSAKVVHRGCVGEAAGR